MVHYFLLKIIQLQHLQKRKETPARKTSRYCDYYSTTKIDEHVRNESVAVTPVIARKGTES